MLCLEPPASASSGSQPQARPFFCRKPEGSDRSPLLTTEEVLELPELEDEEESSVADEAEAESVAEAEPEAEVWPYPVRLDFGLHERLRFFEGEDLSVDWRFLWSTSATAWWCLRWAPGARRDRWLSCVPLAEISWMRTVERRDAASANVGASVKCMIKTGTRGAL